MPSPTALQISSSRSGSTLTPAQKRFNTLIRQIEQARGALAAWNDSIPLYRKAYVEILRPVQDELIALERQWVFALGALLDQGKGTKGERNTVHAGHAVGARDLPQTGQRASRSRAR